MIVFPLVASTMTNSWQNSQKDIALQDVANHVASTIQQIYLTVNRDEILESDITQVSALPVTVASYPYSVTAELTPPSEESRLLTVTVTLDELGNAASASCVLGSNVEWIDSTLRSNSAGSYIKVEKRDGTLTFSFGGSD